MNEFATALPLLITFGAILIVCAVWCFWPWGR